MTNPATATGVSTPEAIVNRPMMAATSPIHQFRPPGFPNPRPASAGTEKTARKYAWELNAQTVFSPA